MSYGGRGREWHPRFVEYVKEIVAHPNYAGIPAVRKADGDIDWTVPSNRKVGSHNWDGNARRREWWRGKAAEFGIPTFAGFWLRDTARANHPFGAKPCQTCGRVLQLAYIYPNKILQKQYSKAFPDSFVDWDEFPTVFDLVTLTADAVGDRRAVAGFAKLLRLSPNGISSLEDLIEAIQTQLVDKDAGPLSPGAMSNSPDRLDGFHTYNLCCRGNQDTGRASSNMSKYVVDRRAYEHWSQGNWALADQIMQSMPVGFCRGPAPCAAKTHQVQLTGDHIGPISLGFRHSAHFNGLCISCNSGKNNRMSLADVRQLLGFESVGEQVISDHAATLWHACANAVASDQDALLLSRVMRINQEMYLRTLALAAATSVPVLLIPRLQLHLAATRITKLELDPITLQLAHFTAEERQGTYAEKRVERVLRVAFESIFGRMTESRNVHLVQLDEIDRLAYEFVEVAESIAIPAELQPLNEWIRSIGGGELIEAPFGAFGRIKELSSLALNIASMFDAFITDSMHIAQADLIGRFKSGDHRLVG